MESQVKKTSVNLLVIATGKYTQFLEGLLDSAQEFFLKECDVNFCVFSDQEESVVRMSIGKEWAVNCLGFIIEHKPFPYPTLHRFHFFKRYQDSLPDADYFFYVDVDALFQKEIKAEDILGERVAVQHCGYVTGGNSYENNPLSRACVAPGEGQQYFGGGFLGASKDEFWRIVDTLTAAIDEDNSNGIIAEWHDESHWNRYLIDNPPTKILSPSYHYPQNNPHIWNKWKQKGLRYEPIILLLDKNHKEIRK